MNFIKLSFIIPCLNEAENIVETLLPLQSLRQRGHEIILSDGGSNDNTIQLSQNLIDHCIHSAAGRSTQMNNGAKAASGDILCFLHADTIASEFIDEQILSSLHGAKNIWGFFNIKLSGYSWQFRIIEWLINKRSCLSHVATGDQGIFVSRDSFNKLSGFLDIPLMEDIELSKRLRKISKPLCIKNQPLITSSRRWQKHGIMRSVLLMWQLRLRYFLGTPAATLARAYQTHSPQYKPDIYPPDSNKQLNENQLIIFVKAPLPGQCKTRLIPFLSAEQASEFYKSLLTTCFDNITPLENTDIAIHIWPETSHPFIQKLGRIYCASLHTQKGDNLGDRMHNALQLSLQTYKKSVLIGSDCPVLDQAYIDKAFNALDQHDMVLGPAEDGGYVLIGATKIETKLFARINWGTASVLKQSLKNSKLAFYKTHLLNTLWDIDTPEDYIQYQSLLEQT